MKRMTIKVIFLAIAGVVFTAGCEEENQIDIKKSRLIAIENKQLKKQSKQLRDEIEKQKELLEQCEEAKKAKKVKVKQPAKYQLDGILGDVLEENQALRKENKKLQTEIGQLKMEIMELKRELEIHKGPTPLPHTD